jgi:uncharacterized membrane protein
MSSKPQAKSNRCEHAETRTRSIVKALVYRSLIVVSIFIITYLETGQLTDAISITGITTITGTIIYYLHERVWSSISWGREK